MPIIPVACRKPVFEALHSQAHLDIRASRQLTSARLVWPCMATNIANWWLECHPCQAAKVTKQPAAPIVPTPVPDRRFSHIHVDLVGHLPASAEGFKYLLTVVDRSTCRLETVPEFTSSSWAAMCQQMGIKHIQTTAYHPQSNGMVERSYCQLEDSFWPQLVAHDWPSHLL
jgi:hypothetical protein